MGERKQKYCGTDFFFHATVPSIKQKQRPRLTESNQHAFFHQPH